MWEWEFSKEDCLLRCHFESQAHLRTAFDQTWDLSAPVGGRSASKISPFVCQRQHMRWLLTSVNRHISWTALCMCACCTCRSTFPIKCHILNSSNFSPACSFISESLASILPSLFWKLPVRGRKTEQSWWRMRDACEDRWLRMFLSDWEKKNETNAEIRWLMRVLLELPVASLSHVLIMWLSSTSAHSEPLTHEHVQKSIHTHTHTHTHTRLSSGARLIYIQKIFFLFSSHSSTRSNHSNACTHEIVGLRVTFTEK